MTYQYITRASDLEAIANEVLTADTVALDLETTGLSPHSSRIRLLSLNTGKGVYVIDLFQTQTLGAVIPALRDSKAVKVGQGLKFDQKFLLHYHGLELWPVFDTHRASAIVYNGKTRGHNLWDIYRRELKMEPTVEDLGASNWAGTLSKAQLDYAADDVIHLPRLREILRAKILEFGLAKTALIEFGAILPEAAMELNGFYLDRERWLALAESNAKQETFYRDKLYAALPHPEGQQPLPGINTGFNLQSPQQLLKSLWKLGLIAPDTAEMTLAMFSDEWPIVADILKYREYAQCLKSFGPEYVKNIDPATGRVHTSFFPFTGAGRYASSKPNLQQIPRGKDFRSCFRAAPGRVLCINDYSQIELRIAAELANDETLLGVYNRGEDAHTQTAALVSDVPVEQVTKSQRQMAKPVNFGLIYGMSADKLRIYAKATYGVTMSVADAVTFRDRYFNAYRGVADWHREIFSHRNRDRGITRTIGGRLRYLDPDMYNEFSNTPVQGTGADGLKASLRIVYHRLKKFPTAKMCHMVHDEIVVEAEPGDAEAVNHEVQLGMIEGMQPFLKKVPVVVEGGVGESWAEK